jgi:hypothetical protein
MPQQQRHKHNTTSAAITMITMVVALFCASDGEFI